MLARVHLLGIMQFKWGEIASIPSLCAPTGLVSFYQIDMSASRGNLQVSNLQVDEGMRISFGAALAMIRPGDGDSSSAVLTAKGF